MKPLSKRIKDLLQSLQLIETIKLGEKIGFNLPLPLGTCRDFLEMQGLVEVVEVEVKGLMSSSLEGQINTGV